MALAGIVLLTGCAAIRPIEDRISADEYHAITAWRAGNYGESSGLYLKLAQSRSQSGLALDASASARHGGMIRQAIEARQAAHAMSPGNWNSWDRLSLARLYLAAGEPSNASMEIDAPVSGWEHITRGQALRRTGRNREALTEFGAARISEPWLALAEQERGETCETLGLMDEAIRAYESALSIDRTQVHLQLRLAHLEDISGKKKASFDRYSRYLIMDPGNSIASAGKSGLIREDARLKAIEAEQDKDRERSWSMFKVKTAAPLPKVPLAPVAVGIVPEASSFRIKCSSGFKVMAGDKVLWTLEQDEEISGEAEEGRILLSRSGASAGIKEEVRFIASSPDSCFALFSVHVAPGYFWSEMETRTYRGNIGVRRNRGHLTVINRVSLEEYLLSCVPAEMPSSWPIEALKAQAVAARSETMSKLGRHKADGFDICSEQHCAVYRGIGNEQKNTTRAVLETRGEILSSSGRPVGAVYADNCGGWGSRPDEVWGSPMPGLAAVCDLRGAECAAWERLTVSPDMRDRFIFQRPDSWCFQADRPSANFRWTRSYLESELSQIINRKYRVGRLKKITIRSHTREGRVTEIEVEGISGRQVIKRDSIRSALGGLRSNFFTMEMLPAPGDREFQYIFIGAGWGHGVGLCQTGARGLALSGKKSPEILLHYYPGAGRKNLY